MLVLGGLSSPNFLCLPKQRSFPEVSDVSRDWIVRVLGDMWWLGISFTPWATPIHDRRLNARVEESDQGDTNRNRFDG